MAYERGAKPIRSYNKVPLQIFFLVFMTLPILIWNMLDRQIWPWDQAWYGSESINLYLTLLNSPSQYFHKLTSLFGSKAPLIAWIGHLFIPLHTLLPTVESTLLFGIWILSALSLVVFYFSLKNLFCTEDSCPALIGSLSLLSFPMFIGLHNQYFVEAHQTFIVILSLYLYSSIKKRPIVINLCLFALVLMLGLLAKITTPYYQAPIFGLSLIELYRDRSQFPKFDIKKKFSFNLLIFLSLATTAFLTFSWYWVNLSTILSFAKKASGSEIGLLYSHHFTFFSKIIFWSKHLFMNIFGVNITLQSVAAVGLSISTIWYLNFKQRKDHVKRTPILLTASIFVLFSIIFFSTQVNEETRYIMPVLIFTALLIGYYTTRTPRVAVGAFFILLIFIVKNYATTFGYIPKTPNIPWVKTINQSDERILETKKVVRLLCSASKINMLGVDLYEINDITFNFFVSQERVRNPIECSFVSIGWAVDDFLKAQKNIDGVNPTGFITLTNSDLESLSDAFNRMSLPAKTYISSKEDWIESPISTDKLIIYTRSIGHSN